MMTKKHRSLAVYLRRYARKLEAPICASDLATLEAARDAEAMAELEAAADAAKEVAVEERAEEVAHALADVAQTFGIKAVFKPATDEERALLLANLDHIVSYIARAESELRGRGDNGLPAALERFRRAVKEARR